MAKSPTVAPAPQAPAAATKTFVLRRPLKGGDGGEVREITLTEPEFRHVVQAARAHPKSRAARTAHMLAALSGVPEEAMHRLVFSDAKAIEDWLEALDQEAVAGDTRDLSADSHEFELRVPIPTDKAPVTHLTVRAPDLGASIAMEKFKTDEERTVAMIAELADLPLPIVMRMKRRDVARIEAWLIPFVSDTSSLADSGGET